MQTDIIHKKDKIPFVPTHLFLKVSLDGSYVHTVHPKMMISAEFLCHSTADLVMKMNILYQIDSQPAS